MLYIGSVFKDRNCPWLPLQKDFIQKTTDVAFEHIPIFSDEIQHRRHEHLDGLELLKRQFLLKEGEANQFLILDSDCFPIRTEWLSLLNQRMGENHIAIATRPENLETRLHCSVMFCRIPRGLVGLRFELDEVKDVAGEREYDICVQPYQNHREHVFPLLRSNRVNLHPVMCGVYFNIFYHHACGSRPYEMRTKHYWGHCTPSAADWHGYTTALFADPSKFIKQLVWDKGNFV